jgi:aspartate kinase
MARVTDGLLKAASLTAKGDKSSMLKLLSDLQARHEGTAVELLEHLQRVLDAIGELFDRLRHTLLAACELTELTPRTTDRIVSQGERLSIELVAAALKEGTVAAELVDVRDCVVTKENYGAATPRFEETNDRLRDRLLPLIRHNVVPVLAGFIASNGKGQTTTLGRGRSDFTAAIVGAALGAERIEIWTDVNAIRTTDPRLCSQTQHIERLNFQETAELDHFGAKVLHPATLLPAIERNIPV